MRRQKKASAKKSNYTVAACIISALAVIAMVILIVMLPKYPSIEYDSEKGVYVIKKTGVEYNYAPVCYEPVTVGSKYAKYGNSWLYEVFGTAPTKWLSEKYDGIGSVFYSTDSKLPDIGEFAADTIYICTVGENVVSIADITDKEVIDEAVWLLENGERLESRPEAEQYYHFKFASEEYSWLYYDVIFIQTSESNYLYNRGLKYTVEVGDLFADYVLSLGSED